MLKKTENILFTTDLSKTSSDAFNHIVLLANQLNASIFLLHVIRKVPESYERRIKRIFGGKKWESIVEQHIKEARDILIGKISSKKIIHAAMKQLCRIAKIQEDQGVDVSAEIIIEKGELVNTILQQAKVHRCDLIAMGASKGLISGKSVGPQIKSVMKKADVPVLVIPSTDDDASQNEMPMSSLIS